MIKVICVGKVKEAYLRDAILDYATRIRKFHKLEMIELSDTNPRDEAQAILKYIDSKDYVITLDIEGNTLDSVAFSAKIDQLFMTNSNIVFVIGGSNGLDVLVKQRGNYSLSFSRLTFPHQLFRVMLLEQIYRSFKILSHQSYHK